MESVLRSHLFFPVLVAVVLLAGPGNCHGQAEDQQAKLARYLHDTYAYWRNAITSRNHSAWKQVTATHRKMAIQNRIISEKGRWPADVFNLPAKPPSLEGLKLLRARSKAMTATAVYFGKVDFGVGGQPTENLLLLSFVYEGQGWKYDTADFINLASLADVRAQLKAGNLAYVDGKDFLPTGVVPPEPVLVPEVKYIAEIYTYCPGREVKARVNRISQHRFQDTQQSEVVIGGARDGANELWYTIRDLPGYKGNDPITVRIYLMSQIPGVKPVKVYHYQTKEGEKPKSQASVIFNVSPATGARILGGR